MIDRTQIPPELGGGVRELAQRHVDTLAQIGESRKQLAGLRLSILQEDFGEQVARYLERTHYDPHIRGRLRRHVTQVFNVGADLTRSLACVYKNGARRSVGKDRGDKALAKLNEATHFGTIAARLNQLGWFVGPTLEVPRVRGKRVTRELITPDRYDLLLDPEDPMGPPIAAAWMWPEGGRQVLVVLDRTHYTYFDPSDTGTPLRAEAHGVQDEDGEPLFPGTLWRFDVPTDPHDYFCKRRHQRVYEATIEVGGIASIMSMVRKSQNRKVIGLFGNLEQLGASAKLDPEKPLTMQIDSTDALPIFKIEDFNTPVEHFRDHIMLLYRTVIEAFGVPQSELTFDAETESTLGGMELKHERLSQLRNEQIPFAREAELSSQYKLAEVVRAAGHKLARGLPTRKQMAQDLTIEFPELNRVEDPSKLKLLTDWELQRGQTTDVQLYQRRHPHLTLAECEDAVRANLGAQGELNELKATRRLDPAAPMEDDNQATGRIGGQAPNPNRQETEQ